MFQLEGNTGFLILTWYRINRTRVFRTLGNTTINNSYICKKIYGYYSAFINLTGYIIKKVHCNRTINFRRRSSYTIGINCKTDLLVVD